MSTENLLAFRQKVDGDAELRGVILRSIQAGKFNDVVGLGKKNGFEFSINDINEIFGPGSSTELSEFELDLVSAAGGLSTTASTPQPGLVGSDSGAGFVSPKPTQGL